MSSKRGNVEGLSSETMHLLRGLAWEAWLEVQASMNTTVANACGLASENV